MRWLGVCRWLHVLLVFGYVFLTIVIIVVLLVVFGVRMANWVRWVMLLGWFAICFGGVVLAEWVGLLIGKGCRKPIRSEEERLSGLMQEVRTRIATGGKGEPKRENKPKWSFGRKMRFLILSAPDRRDGSLGSRTVIISSGTLVMASDEELQGILAHELGHLRDGDRILEAAFLCSGMFALGFRLGWRLFRRVFRSSMGGGLLLSMLLSPVLLLLLFFFCIDSVFRGLKWGLVKLGDFRQDCFVARSGFGNGLRDWLEKSGLAANVDRIRRLEKMK
jgi:hypothetical protein